MSWYSAVNLILQQISAVMYHHYLSKASRGLWVIAYHCSDFVPKTMHYTLYTVLQHAVIFVRYEIKYKRMRSYHGWRASCIMFKCLLLISVCGMLVFELKAKYKPQCPLMTPPLLLYRGESWVRTDSYNWPQDRPCDWGKRFFFKLKTTSPK